ncbi:macro domain-containing protein [Tenacibaculum maritimum]
MHTVGSVYNNGKKVEKEKQLLANCYYNSMLLAIESDINPFLFLI